MNVYQKLNAAREQFHTLKLSKTGHNKFAGYNYFELGDFLIPALNVFKEVGITGVVSFGAETARMTIVNVDKPDETIVIESPMSNLFSSLLFPCELERASESFCFSSLYRSLGSNTFPSITGMFSKDSFLLSAS